MLYYNQDGDTMKYIKIIVAGLLIIIIASIILVNIKQEDDNTPSKKKRNIQLIKIVSLIILYEAKFF